MTTKDLSQVHRSCLLILLLLLAACRPEDDHPKLAFEEVSIIPQPQSMSSGETNFLWEGRLEYFADSFAEELTPRLEAYFEANPGFVVTRAASSEDAKFKIISDNTLEEEHYKLVIAKEGIAIYAKDVAGAYYGLQTLRQMLPIEFETDAPLMHQSFELPGLEIEDGPAFKHRGMHLDVSRHFFGVEAVKRYLEVMAMMKMNTFHWHLTDDQGWRIEIKKYPRLTEHGAYRTETLIGHYNDQPQRFDGKTYGDFYTQEQIKEVVEFAAGLNITVIPEIEMPGHATAAISAYPDLGCTDEEIAVATKWGVFEDIFCPKPETFEFLYGVLDEVIELFPGEYIHIGGDEAPKAQWEQCEFCQELIKDEKLKDEEGLQSFFISKIADYLNSKGKKLLGWDEILEGGLDPTATVMSWRGTEGGIKAARKGNAVIMSPTSHAYFDYYQDDAAGQPLAIGGYLPLEKVYSFNPIPKELRKRQWELVLGAQGNVWTEYIPTEEKLQYMAYPRTMAMAEVVWSGAKEDPDASYPDFLRRVQKFLPRLEAIGRNYYNPLEKITSEIIKNGDLKVSLKPALEEQKLQYRWGPEQAWIDYTEPIFVERSATLEAKYTDGDKAKFNQSFLIHEGLKARVSINRDPHPAYNSGGVAALNNGVQGSEDRYGDKEWLGFWGDDLVVTLRFKDPVKLDSLKLRFFNAPGQWVYAPPKSEISVTLTDGAPFSASSLTQRDSLAKVANSVFALPDTMVTKLRISIPSYGKIPEGLQGAGNKAWTFLDEIILK